MVARFAGRMLGAGLFAAALGLAGSPALAQTYWFESYERAIEHVENGEFAEAMLLLEDVLKLQPAPIPALRVPGARFIDYAPYHYRARIALGLGNAARAAHNLDVSVAFGEPAFSPQCERATAKLREAIAAHRASLDVPRDRAANRTGAPSR